MPAAVLDDLGGGERGDQDQAEDEALERVAVHELVSFRAWLVIASREGAAVAAGAQRATLLGQMSCPPGAEEAARYVFGMWRRLLAGVAGRAAW